MTDSMNSPAVSVVMSVYNGERWLKEAIESVLCQTFTDFEFIIVDDGSIDQSPEIIREYASRDSRIIVITKENSGLAESLNAGIERARGYWIARMDADDICKPDRFQKQVSYLKKYTNIALVSGAVEYIDESGEIFGRTYPITSINQIKKRILNFGNIIVHPAVMMRRDAVNSCGGYCAGLTTVEDSHLWRKLLRKNFDLSILPDVLIYYRISGFAISNRKKTDKLSYLISEVLRYDNPSQELIESFRQEVECNKSNLYSIDTRKRKIQNSVHSKIWKFCNKFDITYKSCEKVLCNISNIYSYLKF